MAWRESLPARGASRAGLRGGALGLLAAACVLAAAAPARAGDEAAGASDDAYLGRLATAVSERLDALAAARAPKLVPPVPIRVAWKPQKLGSLELGAPLAAMAAADLDGDGKHELYAVTARDVVGIAIRGSKATELGRVPFTGGRAVPEPRDVIGTAVATSGELVASASPWTGDMRVAWQGKKLVGQPAAASSLVCPGERVPIAPGKNYFGMSGAQFYAVRCRDDLVDPGGHPLRIRAQLALTGKLAVTIEKCAPGGKPGSVPGGPACRPDAAFELSGVGAAFELADLDRDGTPEVLVSDDAAPGDPDFVKVVSAAAPAGKPLFKKTFQAGVAAIAALDSDGDGAPEVVVAVRLAGATRVDLWRLP
ncbi:MAG TPA: VCBS repeat-containing protein [Kofleriaceae bacterium]|nr:VCBS repeat-containing protein [Kofleriaceae bacterium]